MLFYNGKPVDEVNMETAVFNPPKEYLVQRLGDFYPVSIHAIIGRLKPDGPAFAIGREADNSLHKYTNLYEPFDWEVHLLDDFLRETYPGYSFHVDDNGTITDERGTHTESLLLNSNGLVIASSHWVVDGSESTIPMSELTIELINKLVDSWARLGAKSDSIATYEQLAYWLSKGVGLVRANGTTQTCFMDMSSTPLPLETPLPDGIKVKAFWDKEWVDPTFSYLKRTFEAMSSQPNPFADGNQAC